MKIPKFVSTRTSLATIYHFRIDPPDGFGWALCTVNDGTGELLITSDYGNWSHRWSADPKHLGAATLTHFIAERDPWGHHACQYLADKLTTREQRQRFDREASIAAFRKELCARRLEAARERPRSRLTREVARYIWDNLGRIDEYDSTLFCERFMEIDDYRLLDVEPWESLEYKPTTEYLVLRDGILPALVEACAAEVKRREVPAVTAPATEVPRV